MPRSTFSVGEVDSHHFLAGTPFTCTLGRRSRGSRRCKLSDAPTAAFPPQSPALELKSATGVVASRRPDTRCFLQAAV